MAAGDSTDMFMILQSDKGWLVGESRAELHVGPANALAENFDPGWMFEVTKLGFGVGVQPEAIEAMEYPEHAGRHGKHHFVKSAPRRRRKPGQSLDETPVTIQPISFSRSMDKASCRLLHHTIKRTFFRRAAIVKRKSAGGPAAGQPYLRLDFKGVILISAHWSDDQPVEEQYEFHARAITMRYAPQNPDGTLRPPLRGFWSMVPNETFAELS